MMNVDELLRGLRELERGSHGESSNIQCAIHGSGGLYPL